MWGTVRVPGAKNSILKPRRLPAAGGGADHLTEVPDILTSRSWPNSRRLGCDVGHDPAAGILFIDVPSMPAHQADYDLVRQMRASICVLGTTGGWSGSGPMGVARWGRHRIPGPTCTSTG